MCFIRDEKGAAMIVALLVMVVLLLLGTALWQYSTSDTIHVAMDEKRMQAYYLARAGADATLEIWMQSDNESRPSGESEPVYFDEDQGSFTSDYIENAGKFVVTINTNGDVTSIESIGTVDDISQKVTVNVSAASQYGHDLGWYDQTSGRIYDITPEPFEGAVILDAHSANTIFQNSNVTSNFTADSMFFLSALGNPVNGGLTLSANTIVFKEEIYLGNQGDHFVIKPYPGKDEMVVYFSEVFYQNKNDETYISKKAFKVFESVDIRTLRTQANVQKAIDDDIIELIPSPTVPNPEANYTVTWN